MIHVLIVDEQRLFSEAVASLISAEENMEVVGQATTIEDALELVRDKRPDVILIDVQLRGGMVIRATNQIKQSYDMMKVIFLTSSPEEDVIISGVVTGADAIVFKDLDGDSLIRTIQSVYQGQVVLSAEVAKVLARQIVQVKFNKETLLKKQLDKRGIHLTAREIEIAAMLMNHERNKAIAEKLFLSEGTVKNYISDIYRKLGLRNRKHVIAYLRGLFTNYEVTNFYDDDELL